VKVFRFDSGQISSQKSIAPVTRTIPGGKLDIELIERKSGGTTGKCARGWVDFRRHKTAWRERVGKNVLCHWEKKKKKNIQSGRCQLKKSPQGHKKGGRTVNKLNRQTEKEKKY